MAIIEFTGNIPLESEIIQHELVLLDFWALWCAPCRAMLPSVKELSKHPKLTVIAVNADEYPQELENFNVRGLPCLMFFQQGMLVTKTHDTLSMKQLKEWLSPYLPDEALALLQVAEALSGTAQFDALRQVVKLNPMLLVAQEKLLGALYQARKDDALLQELSSRMDNLTAEQLRSPVLSRIHSVLSFAQDLSHQPKFLQPSFQLAIDEHYEQAAESLLNLLASAHSAEETAEIKHLAFRILDLMPDRKQAHGFRRKFLS